jgi:hypothetical protein
VTGSDLAFAPQQIAELRNFMLRFSECAESEDGEGKRYRFNRGRKTLEFLWPQHAPEELWILFVEDNILQFSMVEEDSTEDGKAQILRHFETVAVRFFDHETRIARRPWLIGRKTLQYFDGISWRNLYS